MERIESKLLVETFTEWMHYKSLSHNIYEHTFAQHKHLCLSIQVERPDMLSRRKVPSLPTSKHFSFLFSVTANETETKRSALQAAA